jgi:hypothetical protein
MAGKRNNGIGLRIGKQDVKSAMRDIIQQEMRKQQQADMEETIDQLYTESYADKCPYCGAVCMVDGKKFNPDAEVTVINGKKYLMGKCSECEKTVYVKVSMQSPKSMLDSPSPMGKFYTESHVTGNPEPETHTVIHGKRILPVGKK